MAEALLSLRINGEAVHVAAPAHWTLLEVLRYRLDLIGSKQGCDKGDCGACTVLLDGEAVLSCLLPIQEAAGRSVVTVEGLADGPRPSPLQEAFDLTGAAQCGFCTPGILCTASQLLSDNPSPTRAEIARALSGNLCRCTGYTKILEAVEVASEAERSGRSAADVLAARRSADPAASPLVEGNR